MSMQNSTSMAENQNVSEFIKLLTSHQVRLRAFALSLIPHWADAEEVIQEANLVMWKKFEQFTVGTSFFSWACKIIHLTAKDFRKRQGRSKVRFGEQFMELVAEQTVELEDELREREAVLNNCIGRLKEKHRQMLHLRYQEGFTVERLAETLGSTAKAIYQALSRVHKALFDCVERHLSATGSS